MSFFLQSERKTGMEKAGAPAPTQYNPYQSQTARKFACAPFGSTQGLSRAGRTEKKSQLEMKDDVMKQQELALKDLRMKVKTQQQGQSMFKSTTQRVKFANEQRKPGVGSYNLDDSRLGMSKSMGMMPKQSQSLYSKPKGTVPSIPADNLGFKEDERNEMKKVVPPDRAPPHPGSYELRTSLMGKGGTQWKMDTIIKRQPQAMPGPGQYNPNRKGSKSMSSFNSGPERFGRTHKITEEKRPGPGAYNISSNRKASYNATTEGYFNSKSSRFPRDALDSTGEPANYFDSRKKSSSVTQLKRVFHRQQKEPKQFNRGSIFDTNNKNPGPGEYKNTYGMSHQLQATLMRKKNLNVMPKSQRKVFEPRDEQDPGPGTYEQPTKPKPKGKIWKKTEVVNLKEPEEPMPSPMQYTNMHNTIESKIKQMNAKLTLTDEKPFNSGSERFKHYTNTNTMMVQQDPQEYAAVDESVLKGTPVKKVKRLVMTTIKVRVPFGISSNKYQDRTVGTYDGPDYYAKPSQWVKPTFNIKGQLQ